MKQPRFIDGFMNVYNGLLMVYDTDHGSAVFIATPTWQPKKVHRCPCSGAPVADLNFSAGRPDPKPPSQQSPQRPTTFAQQNTLKIGNRNHLEDFGTC